MKEENKKIGVIGSIVWLVASIVLIIYAFTLPKTSNGEKEVTLEVRFEDKTYRFEELTSDATNLYSFLAQYNTYLQLNCSASNEDGNIALLSCKGSFVNDDNGNEFIVKINGEKIASSISEQAFTDGDEIAIEYTNIATGELVKGGNDTIDKTPDNPNKSTFIVVGVLCAVVSAITLIVWLVRKRKESK